MFASDTVIYFNSYDDAEGMEAAREHARKYGPEVVKIVRMLGGVAVVMR